MINEPYNFVYYSVSLVILMPIIQIPHVTTIYKLLLMLCFFQQFNLKLCTFVTGKSDDVFENYSRIFRIYFKCLLKGKSFVSTYFKGLYNQ